VMKQNEGNKIIKQNTKWNDEWWFKKKRKWKIVSNENKKTTKEKNLKDNKNHLPHFKESC
jgi:hypothetical protein